MYRFSRLLLLLLFGLAAALPGWAQDSAPENPPADEAAAAEEESDEEEVDVDDGSYIDAEEEDFRPSEVVPADQSIDFPTDI